MGVVSSRMTISPSIRLEALLNDLIEMKRWKSKASRATTSSIQHLWECPILDLRALTVSSKHHLREYILKEQYSSPQYSCQGVLKLLCWLVVAQHLTT